VIASAFAPGIQRAGNLQPMEPERPIARPCTVKE